jgi:hypothetical protein
LRSIAGAAGFDGFGGFDWANGFAGGRDADGEGDGVADPGGDDGTAAGGAPCSVPAPTHPVASVSIAATAIAPARVLRTAPPSINRRNSSM